MEKKLEACLRLEQENRVSDFQCRCTSLGEHLSKNRFTTQMYLAVIMILSKDSLASRRLTSESSMPACHEEPDRHQRNLKLCVKCHCQLKMTKRRVKQIFMQQRMEGGT